MAKQPQSLNSLSRDMYAPCAEGQVLVKDSSEPSGVAPADNGGGGGGTVTTSSPLDGDGSGGDPITLPTTADVTVNSLTASAGLSADTIVNNLADYLTITPPILANNGLGSTSDFFIKTDYLGTQKQFVFGADGSMQFPGALFSINSVLSLRAASGGSVQLSDADAAKIFTFTADPPSMSLPENANVIWESGSFLNDAEGVLSIFSDADSVVFNNTGIEFSAFAIHPQSAEDGSVGTAALPFGNVYASQYTAGGSAGATGSFTAGADTVTVVGGIITAITP